MKLELTILLLRLGILALVYLFLLQMVLLIRRDLKAPSHPLKRALGRLVVIESGESGLSPGDNFELETINSLGRSPLNTILLDDDYVSAEHALLSYRQRQWWLEDLGSTNGTLVNRRLVDGPTLVVEGDVIGIGRVRLRLERS